MDGLKLSTTLHIQSEKLYIAATPTTKQYYKFIFHSD